MAVKDDHVLVLQAFLARDFDEYDRLSEHLDSTGGWEGYPTLLQAAFFEAVERRFGTGHTVPAIVEYVADARSRYERSGQVIDPGAAERLMLLALGDEVSVDDIDGKTLGATELFILATLITDANLDDASLNKFMKDVRESAAEWSTNE